MGLEEYYEEYWSHRKDINHLYEEWVPSRVIEAVNLIQRSDYETILDVGCGEGVLARELTRRGFSGDIYGCDISPTALELGDSYYTETTIAQVEEDSLIDIFEPEKYDCIVCLEVLEHVFNPGAVLSNIRSTLSDDGCLLVSIPNFVHYRHRFDILLGRAPTEYTLYSDAEHIQNFTIESIQELLEQNNFEIDSIFPYISSPWFMPRLIAEKYPSIFASQILIHARPG